MNRAARYRAAPPTLMVGREASRSSCIPIRSFPPHDSMTGYFRPTSCINRSLARFSGVRSLSAKPILFGDHAMAQFQVGRLSHLLLVPFRRQSLPAQLPDYRNVSMRGVKQDAKGPDYTHDPFFCVSYRLPRDGLPLSGRIARPSAAQPWPADGPSRAGATTTRRP